MRPALQLWVWVVMTAAVAVHGQVASDSRRETLDELLRLLRPSRPPVTGRINAVDRTWEDWIRRSGELPPDFEAMPSIPELPDPLLFRENGRTVPVTTPDLWARQLAVVQPPMIGCELAWTRHEIGTSRMNEVMFLSARSSVSASSAPIGLAS
jgi:hypothetical protein